MSTPALHHSGVQGNTLTLIWFGAQSSLVKGEDNTWQFSQFAGDPVVKGLYEEIDLTLSHLTFTRHLVPLRWD